MADLRLTNYTPKPQLVYRMHWRCHIVLLSSPLFREASLPLRDCGPDETLPTDTLRPCRRWVTKLDRSPLVFGFLRTIPDCAFAFSYIDAGFEPTQTG